MYAGNWAAYRRMAENDVNFVLHLGDYIYEAPSSSAAAVKQQVHDVPIDAPKTLAVGGGAFLVQDRSGDSNGARRVPGSPSGMIMTSRTTMRGAMLPAGRRHVLAAACRGLSGLFGRMPLRNAQSHWDPDAILYRRLGFGDLIDLIMLDERQYRSPLACSPPAPALDRNQLVSAAECADAFDPSEPCSAWIQESWLARGLAEPGS